ncbi:hypothetical protein FQA47_006500 [Oryzias melastigma]|uniref:Uncharacterized protein n=1 Tax=Oryzias melastigma TaxID=30732 RepID=A0A834L064_ORYME|nr:hypothetical protein FQA47_006500 [Oryzias melastigma]
MLVRGDPLCHFSLSIPVLPLVSPSVRLSPHRGSSPLTLQTSGSTRSGVLLGFAAWLCETDSIAGMPRSSNSETPKADLTLSSEPEMTSRCVRFCSVLL